MEPSTANNKKIPPHERQCLPEENTLRAQVLQSSRNFKHSWRKFGEVLSWVWQEKIYRQWGFDDFDGYINQELKIKKLTALKLIRSHLFLKKELPDSSGAKTSDQNQEMPTLEMVTMLQKAKKSLDAPMYQKVKQNFIENTDNYETVKKEVVDLIRQRKAHDPDEEKRKQKLIVIQFIHALKKFRNDVQLLNVLPAPITNEIDRLIQKIETEQKRSQ